MDVRRGLDRLIPARYIGSNRIGYRWRRTVSRHPLQFDGRCAWQTQCSASTPTSFESQSVIIIIPFKKRRFNSYFTRISKECWRRAVKCSQKATRTCPKDLLKSQKNGWNLHGRSWKNYQLFQKFKSWWSSRDCLLSKLIIILIESLMIPKKKKTCWKAKIISEKPE